jgi:hypothetical protein
MLQSVEAHLGSRQVARVIYGSIIGLALVVALQGHPPSAGRVLATLWATALAVGLAELYSDVVGTETRTRHRIARTELVHVVDQAGAVAFGIAFPGVFFILAALGVIDVDSAFTVAKWSGLALIAAYGFGGARLAGASVVASLVQAFAVGAIGGVLIAVKALLH